MPRTTFKLGPRFENALRFALKVHRHDTRKGKPTPYVSHLLGVCSLVLQHGGNEDEAIGALLHDTLEDHPETVTPAILRRRFGPRVLTIVEGCTDTPPGFTGGLKPPWRSRKTSYIAHIAVAPRPVRIVALADKLYNLLELNSDLRVHGKATMKRFNAGPADQSWYFTSVLRALRAVGDDGPMLASYERAVQEFRRLIR